MLEATLNRASFFVCAVIAILHAVTFKVGRQTFIHVARKLVVETFSGVYIAMK